MLELSPQLSRDEVKASGFSIPTLASITRPAWMSSDIDVPILKISFTFLCTHSTIA